MSPLECCQRRPGFVVYAPFVSILNAGPWNPFAIHFRNRPRHRWQSSEFSNLVQVTFADERNQLVSINSHREATRWREAMLSKAHTLRVPHTGRCRPDRADRRNLAADSTSLSF